MGGMSETEYWNTCATPGAVYETKLKRSRVMLHVILPEPLLKGFSNSRKQHLIRLLHHAILPVIEGIYQEQWGQLAGRLIEGDKSPLPAKWTDLFNADQN